MTNTKHKGASKRDSISLVKKAVREIEEEISWLRAKQQGLEKALSILLGEGP
jgi:hypothetical protein